MLFRLIENHVNKLENSFGYFHFPSAKSSGYCHLSVLDGNKMVVLKQLDSPKRVSVHVRTGTTLDLLESNTARVLLAFKSKAEQEALLSIDPMFVKMEIEAKNKLFEQLSQIRTSGHLHTESYTIAGITDLAVPVMSNSGEAIAALAVPCVKYIGEDIPTNTIIQKLKETANAIALHSGVLNV